MTIRTYPGDYARRSILASAAEYRQDENGKTVIIGTLDKARLAKRLAALVGWTLWYDDAETPIPFTEENIKNLPDDMP